MNPRLGDQSVVSVTVRTGFRKTRELAFPIYLLRFWSSKVVEAINTGKKKVQGIAGDLMRWKTCHEDDEQGWHSLFCAPQRASTPLSSTRFESNMSSSCRILLTEPTSDSQYLSQVVRSSWPLLQSLPISPDLSHLLCPQAVLTVQPEAHAAVEL